MAIHNEVVREGSEGIVKQFEMSAASMLFDNLQKNQYQYPEKSTIRELVSNAVDAIREKNTALEIINGKAKAEDYYLTREEPMFVDSNYMPEYYSKEWLDANKNEVQIIYEESLSGAGRDTLRIIDNGVGIGHIINPKTKQSRLQGVLKLGYSTKRNSSIPLGKFGIGAKAALSTGVDSYTMITRHNGMEFRFEVYDYKADPLVPKFNMDTGQENPYITFEEWQKRDLGNDVEGEPIFEWVLATTHKIYYLVTKEKNGTEIIVPAKRHHRATYLGAVQSQLLYFKNIKFTVHRENGAIEEINVQAEIKYEDEYIILSNNTQFSKPHLVLNGVNYGYVNFQELELEERLGNIGYKIKPESVTVNPSRESLVWDDNTRKTVLAMQKKVAETASKMVAQELNDTDLIEWVRKCTLALGDSRDKESIVGILAGMVERRELKPVFQPFPDILYDKEPENFFQGMELIHVFKTTGKKNGETVDKVGREKVKTWTMINKPLYLQEKTTSNKREAHLLQLHPEGFIKLKVRDVRMSYQEGSDLSSEELAEYERLKNDEEYYGKWLKKQEIFYGFIKASKAVTIYESIIIPGKEGEDEDDTDEAADTVIKGMTPAELREIQGKTVCMYPVWASYYGDKNFRWEKKEPVIKDLMLDPADIVYGFQEDEELIHMVANMLSTRGDHPAEFYNKGFKLIRIAKTAAKHFRDHIYIKDFILSIHPDTRTITMHNKLVNWHTGRKIHEVLPRMQFLENFGRFNPEIQRLYDGLKTYKEENFKEVKGSTKFGCNDEMLTELNQYADKVASLQLYIHKHPGNTDAIAAQAKSLFETPEGEETFDNALGVDIEIYTTLEKILEFIEPLENILNYISPLIKRGENIPDTLEIEIREIMRNKGIIS